MASSTVGSEAGGAGTGNAVAPEKRRGALNSIRVPPIGTSANRVKPSAPVKAWALLGFLSMGLVVQGWTRWIFSSDFAPSPSGPDQMAGGKLVLMRFAEVSSAALGLFVLWYFLIRPLFRQRTLTFDGKFILGLFFMWFYDPTVNYFNFSFTWNAQLVNMGSWSRFIPGMNYPNMEHYPEALAFVGGQYLWYFFGVALIGCAGMRRLSMRFPNMSLLGLFATLFCLFFAFDLLLESAFIRTELMAYPGLPRFGTIFPGTRYQFPAIWEPLLAAVVSTALTSLRYLRDDRGQSFVERGVDQLGLPARLQQVVAFFAIAGFSHFVVMAGYNVPYSWLVGLQADTAPALPSYIRAGICGSGTDYACPSKGLVPVPSRTSLHISPDDPRLPESVRIRQGFRVPIELGGADLPGDAVPKANTLTR